MKLALINPGKDQSYAIQEPLNLGYLASYLLQNNNNIEVKIIDELSGDNVKKQLQSFSPDIAAITGTTPLINESYNIADYCKSHGITTVLGGPHVSVLSNEALQHSDIVAKGEGEKSLRYIAQNPNIKGIVLPNVISNIDDIPPPSRHLMNMDFYLKTKDRYSDTYLDFVPPHTNTASLLTSRGCPYSCTFCHNTWKDTPYRSNSPERVLSEITALQESYNVKAIFFIEDNFFVNQQRLKKICSLIIKNDIDIIWGCNARVTDINEKNLEIVKLAGCKQITFGFESGSQKVLDTLKKGTTIAQNQKAIDMCLKLDIIPQGTFMIGNPDETIKDMKLTKDFILNSGVQHPGLCITTPFPGTEIWKWCEEQALIPNHINYKQFSYDNAYLVPNNVMSSEIILNQYYEIVDEMNCNTKLKFKEVINHSFKHPIQTCCKVLRKPKKIIQTIKRLS